MLAVFCEVIANSNPELSEFRHTMDDLNRLLKLNATTVPLPVRQRLREYFHQTKHIQVASAGQRVIDQLSVELQGEVVLLINQHWLKRIWFLKVPRQRARCTCWQAVTGANPHAPSSYRPRSRSRGSSPPV